MIVITRSSIASTIFLVFCGGVVSCASLVTQQKPLADPATTQQQSVDANSSSSNGEYSFSVEALSPEVHRVLKNIVGLYLGRENVTDYDSLLAPPESTREAWEQLVIDLDVYLNQPLGMTPLIDLIQLRGVIEQELEADRQSWRISAALDGRIGSRLAYLEHRIEQVREIDVAEVGRGEETLSLSWPMAPIEITSSFGWRRHPVDGVRRFHLGVDLRATVGQSIVAAGPGLVTWAGWRGGHGHHVEIEHGRGWVTRYSHLANVMVEVGQRVNKDDVIGFAGDSGRVTGPHLHFEVWRNGRAKDPVVFLGGLSN